MAVETWIIADTDTHYGAVITTTGQQLDAARFPTSRAGSTPTAKPLSRRPTPPPCSKCTESPPSPPRRY